MYRVLTAPAWAIATETILPFTAALVIAAGVTGWVLRKVMG